MLVVTVVLLVVTNVLLVVTNVLFVVTVVNSEEHCRCESQSVDRLRCVSWDEPFKEPPGGGRGAFLFLLSFDSSN